MQKKKKYQYGGSTFVEKPKNTLAISPNYEGNKNVGESIVLKELAKKEAKEEANRKKLALMKKQGYTTGTGQAEPVYPEALLFPATPELKALGKIGNFALDAVNPVGGFRESLPNRQSISAIKNFFGVKPKIDEQRVFDKSKKWIQDWYSHPEIIRRREIYDKHNLGNKSADFEIYNKGQAAVDKVENVSSTANAFYAPVNKRSYIDFNSDLTDERNAISVGVHEGTHFIDNVGDSFYTPLTAQHSTKDLLKKPFKDVKPTNDYDEYIIDPEEIHARMNELRYKLNLKPTDKFTIDHLNSPRLNKLFPSSSGVLRMRDLITDKDAFVDAMNKMYTPAGIVGTGVAASQVDKQQFGMKIKKKQMGGQAGSPVLIEKGEYYRDSEGNIQYAEMVPSHDDDEVLIGTQEFPAQDGRGGQIVEAQNVLSASYDQVQDGTRESTAKERRIAITPKEQKELFGGFDWFKPTKGKASPSKLVEHTTELVNKHNDKYIRNPSKDGLGLLTKATNAANQAQLINMPSMDFIYDTVLEHQEGKKYPSEKQDTSIAKSGIYIKPENRGKFTATKKRTGKTTEELTHSKNPLTRKRAQFALNARKWKHQEGGVPVSYDGLYEYPEQEVIVPSGDITMQGIPYPVEAYDADSGEFLDTMYPDEEYQFDVDNVLEVPKAQTGLFNYGERPQVFVNDLNLDNNPVPVKKKPTIYNKKNINDWLNYQRKAAPDFGVTYVEDPITGETVLVDGSKQYSGYNTPPFIPETSSSKKKVLPKKGTLSKKSKPDVAWTNQADEVVIKPEVPTIGQPVDRMSEVANLEPIDLASQIQYEYPNDIPTLDVAPEIPTLNVSATNVAPLVKKAGETLANVAIGKLNRKIPHNALDAMRAANRTVQLPYRQSLSFREQRPMEMDASSRLNQLSATVNQQLQAINMNTPAGQAMANSILLKKKQAEDQILAQVGQMNANIRNQTEARNIQARTAFENTQEQLNAQYVQGVQQTLSNLDTRKVQEAQVLDNIIRERARQDNAIAMSNARNPNYQIDPVTGEVVRIGKQLGELTPKAKWGLRK